jgi:anti-sigma factor RsiW
MTPHLTSHLTKEELTDNLLGVSSLTVNAHLLGCPACAEELERIKSSIAGFREAAQGWSEHAMVAAAESGTVRSRTAGLRSRPTWILAMAALILFVAGSLTYLHKEPAVSQGRAVAVSTPTATAALSQAQLDQDNQLLSQVSVELSEAVPAPMQPLLVSESGASVSGAKK